MIGFRTPPVLAKIAAPLEAALAERARSGGPGTPRGRVLARGPGWTVEDMICTSGPSDARFDEVHHDYAVALVLAGTFHYRTGSERHLMTPGSFLLGDPGQGFECGHEHGAGDRCLSFRFTAEWMEGAGPAGRRFGRGRLPPDRATAPLAGWAGIGVADPAAVSWEELATAVAGTALDAAMPVRRAWTSGAGGEASVAAIVRRMSERPDQEFPLAALAAAARLSPYHFLRVFERATGTTPHQYLLRARLRAAALDLALGDSRVIEVALRAGFGDLSNFNRTFRREFGIGPLGYRRTGGKR